MKKLLEVWPTLAIIGALLVLGATGATLWSKKANADEFAQLKTKVDKLEQAFELLDDIHQMLSWQKNEKR